MIDRVRTRKKDTLLSRMLGSIVIAFIRFGHILCLGLFVVGLVGAALFKAFLAQGIHILTIGFFGGIVWLCVYYSLVRTIGASAKKDD